MEGEKEKKKERKEELHPLKMSRKNRTTNINLDNPTYQQRAGNTE